MAIRLRVHVAAAAAAALSIVAMGRGQDASDPDVGGSGAAPTPTPSVERVFRGSVTVSDSPIIEQSELDPLSSLVTTISEQQIDDLYAQDLSSALRRVPGVVFLANAKFAMPWRALGLELDGAVFLVGENLGDEEYEYRVGYPMPGRMWHLGLELGF